MVICALKKKRKQPLTVDDVGHSPAMRAPIDTWLYNTNETAAVGHNAVNASVTVEEENKKESEVIVWSMREIKWKEREGKTNRTLR